VTSRTHLTTVRLFSALADTLRERAYGWRELGRDAIAGLTVGIVAVPLAMALAIASGMPPERGLYTAAVAGFVAALAGGSRFSVSGPTAAFVVILEPIARTYGFAGLGTATVLAGLILLALGVAKLGRLIEYVPEPVTIGFTSGIAIVLATLQLKDFLGLRIAEMPEQFVGKLGAIATALPTSQWPTALVAVLTLAVLVFWPRERIGVPGHLPALALGAVAALLLARGGHPVDTIGSRFIFQGAGGVIGHGIPQALPRLVLPWTAATHGHGALTAEQVVKLLPAAGSIAVLGAIESLLCAVVLDKMSGTRHHANGELVGQGLANMVAPFFGGFSATAAIARSAVNVRSGAVSPVSAMIHALVVVLAILVLAPALAFVPMASMAALLMTVAWNMSEAPHVVHLVRTRPRGDVLVFAVCLVLTVFVDMIAAIGVGVVLASMLFMRDMADLTVAKDISTSPKHVPGGVPDGWRVYQVVGPLFFAAAERVLGQILDELPRGAGVILYLDAVTVLDAGGLSAFGRFVKECRARDIAVIVADAQGQPGEALERAGMEELEGVLAIDDTLRAAVVRARDAGAR
jgi:SulP family sulfate permease